MSSNTKKKLVYYVFSREKGRQKDSKRERERKRNVIISAWDHHFIDSVQLEQHFGLDLTLSISPRFSSARLTTTKASNNTQTMVKLNQCGASLTDEADLFMDVGLALVEEGRVESQRSHSQEEFVDVETGFGRNGPIFCLQRPGHSRCLIFNIRVRRFGLHHPIILISIISPCQFQCNYHYLCFLIRLLLAMFRIS